MENSNRFIENLAPIVLFTYNRPRHVNLTIEALKKNKYAEDSNIFIYSDKRSNKFLNLLLLFISYIIYFCNH